jgi:hypothetical protein
VRDEILMIHCGLSPWPNLIPVALAAHAAWLQEGARNGTSENVSMVVAPADPHRAGPCVDPWIDAGYLAIREGLVSQLSAISAARSSHSGRPPREAVCHFLIARLAHTQALRLWGPQEPDELSREAALVREAAAELARGSDR